MSIFDLSQRTADLWYEWANWAQALGAALVLIGFLVAFWTGSIRERYTNGRLSQNAVATAAAQALAATANEGAAKANERSESLRQSNLELQRQVESERIERLRLEATIAPRKLSSDQRTALVAAFSRLPRPVHIGITRLGDSEAGPYADAIVNAAAAAGIQAV